MNKFKSVSFQGRKHSRYVRGATVSVEHFHKSSAWPILLVQLKFP